jgi:DNA-binding transcriptional MerR regulator
MAPKQVKKQIYYKIGEACKLLDIQPYVLRYWETEFPQLAPSKSKSGQRVYSEKELALVARIKELLYEEGYTIAGAKKKLESEIQPDGTIAPAEEAPAPPAAAQPAQLRMPSAGDDGASLDSSAAEKLKTLHEEITAVLRDAREILSLLRTS